MTTRLGYCSLGHKFKQKYVPHTLMVASKCLPWVAFHCIGKKTWPTVIASLYSKDANWSGHIQAGWKKQPEGSFFNVDLQYFRLSTQLLCILLLLFISAI